MLNALFVIILFLFCTVALFFGFYSRKYAREGLFPTLMLAKTGDTAAQVRLGSWYQAGDGLKQSFEEAVHWYRRAADLGDADGQYRLALLYRDGSGVFQCQKTAAYWFLKAAKQGMADAQHQLARIFHQGEGVERSLEQSLFWCVQAAQQGSNADTKSAAKVSYLGLPQQEACGGNNKIIDISHYNER